MLSQYLDDKCTLKMQIFLVTKCQADRLQKLVTTRPTVVGSSSSIRMSLRVNVSSDEANMVSKRMVDTIMIPLLFFITFSNAEKWSPVTGIGPILTT